MHIKGGVLYTDMDNWHALELKKQTLLLGFVNKNMADIDSTDALEEEE